MAAIAMAGVCAFAAASDIAGLPPAYGPGAPVRLPNAGAIERRIWVPGLDAYFDPQGLAIADDAIVVSGFVETTYVSNDDKGQCQLFRIDRATGRTTGTANVLELPTCGHAGGLAYAANQVLYIADSATLFRTTLDTAFGGHPQFRRFPLASPLTGGNAASEPGAIWLGTYDETGPGRLYRFDLAKLEELADGTTLTRDDATRSIAIPSYAQGAAFDRDGGLWIARSDIEWGSLERIDKITGAAIAHYDIPAGSEGIAFDTAGRLWAVAEAGARRFYDVWLFRSMFPFNPLIYAIDVEKLQP